MTKPNFIYQPSLYFIKTCHFKSKHENFVKEFQYFERLLEDLKNRRNTIKPLSDSEQTKML